MELLAELMERVQNVFKLIVLLKIQQEFLYSSVYMVKFGGRGSL